MFLDMPMKVLAVGYAVHRLTELSTMQKLVITRSVEEPRRFSPRYVEDFRPLNSFDAQMDAAVLRVDRFAP